MTMEILAPAGSRESLEAAVRCGTDSVYLGASAFNARRNADNFDALSLSDAVKYCHGRHVRVYVTLNTLIFNSEERKFLSCLEEVLDAGPDCLIVQDLGVVHLIRSVCSGVPICASTQMAIHNSSGARALEDMGITQAVLARELSLDEISKIHEQTSLRLETFVHGAHCMSVSGLCYFSAALGERSGNRGLCAQPCRLDFRCKGREYALSLKDLSFVRHIDELKEAGVSSLKIEGRMKRPEYVAAAVTAVKKAVMGETSDVDNLKKVFSRSGFTDGYLTGKRNAKMFGIRSSEDVSSAKEVLGQLAGLYRRECSRVPVSMDFRADENACELTVSDGKNTVCSGMETVREDTGILTAEIAERSLRKTGNTPYYPERVSVKIDDGIRIPASMINALRKQSLEDLQEKSSSGIIYERTDFVSTAPVARLHRSPVWRARFNKVSQIASPDKFEMIILPLEEILRDPQVISVHPCVCAELPTVVWEGTEQKLLGSLKELYASGLRHLSVATLGHIRMVKDFGFTLHGEQTLNITNSHALEQYAALGVSDTLLSTELTVKQAGDLFGNIPAGIYVFGRLPLMFFRSCPARSDTGCGSCPGYSEITDKTRASFPLICHQKQYSVMHNSVPLYLGDSDRPPVDFVEFYFSTETKNEAVKIVTSFENKEKIGIPFTRGHAFNGVR